MEDLGLEVMVQDVKIININIIAAVLRLCCFDVSSALWSRSCGPGFDQKLTLPMQYRDCVPAREECVWLWKM